MLSRALRRLLPPPAFSSLPTPPAAGAALHTSAPQDSRAKKRFTHKPFWRPTMSYRAEDDPVTWENRQFIEQMKRDAYVNTRSPAPAAASGGGERFVLSTTQLYFGGLCVCTNISVHTIEHFLCLQIPMSGVLNGPINWETNYLPDNFLVAR